MPNFKKTQKTKEELIRKLITPDCSEDDSDYKRQPIILDPAGRGLEMCCSPRLSTPS